MAAWRTAKSKASTQVNKTKEHAAEKQAWDELVKTPTKASRRKGGGKEVKAIQTWHDKTTQALITELVKVTPEESKHETSWHRSQENRSETTEGEFCRCHRWVSTEQLTQAQEEEVQSIEKIFSPSNRPNIAIIWPGKERRSREESRAIQDMCVPHDVTDAMKWAEAGWAEVGTAKIYLQQAGEKSRDEEPHNKNLNIEDKIPVMGFTRISTKSIKASGDR